MCAAVMQSRLPQATSLLSVLGYAIVFSEKYAFVSKGLAATTGTVVAAPFKTMFMGGLFILFAMSIYWLFCPYPIKRFRDRRDYVDYVVRGLDPSEPDHAARAIESIPSDSVVQRANLRVQQTDLDIAKSEGIATSVLASDYYTLLDRQGMRMPMVCFSMFMLGALLFLMPAVISVVTALPRALEIFDDRGLPM
ncbi:hypothetical protein IHQ71_26720 [Rhizobium sp. TH2]|uniref:hypothetical protein n=1 Tax=Rhizobium sp. TH2 TaxID=2775403 RepID=UPI0021574CFD|nr:hypothetical protein [Rhizobium sp. TH2]UVC08679.1 hypothetical protein IHQ71_26720 [Rhizobium sp. TH2]